MEKMTPRFEPSKWKGAEAVSCGGRSPGGALEHVSLDKGLETRIWVSNMLNVEIC